MSKFKNYKDLDIWQKAFNMSLMVFNLCKKIPFNSVNKVLVNQIVRSVTSIAGNIAEGSGGATRKDFINYLQNARKSALETDNWLEFIFSTNKVTSASKKMLKEKSQEIIKILTTIIKKSKLK
ncbi:MAG: four helix bundle protein [Candidatus Kerfeldbacteria bacterium]|jgi:four helix bundle protein